MRSRDSTYVVVRVAPGDQLLYATDRSWTPAREHAHVFTDPYRAEAVARLLRAETGDRTVTAQRLRVSTTGTWL